jgi:hypothetical protein
VLPALVVVVIVLALFGSVVFIAAAQKKRQRTQTRRPSKQTQNKNIAQRRERERENEPVEEDVEGRENWFWHQRMYPFNELPEDGREKAWASRPVDFLNRVPDQSGWDFWTNQMTNCGAADLLVCRINVSGSFFLSIEFQQTGYLVERMYKVSYGDVTGNSTIGGAHTLQVPVVRFNEFLHRIRNASVVA